MDPEDEIMTAQLSTLGDRFDMIFDFLQKYHQIIIVVVVFIVLYFLVLCFANYFKKWVAKPYKEHINDGVNTTRYTSIPINE